MYRSVAAIALLTLALLLPLTTAAESERRDPRAIEILERADAAIRAVPGLAFRSHYVGTHTSRGRMTADVLLRRDGGRDDAIGTIAYRLRAGIDVAEAPYAQEHLPRRYVLADGPAGATLVDPEAKTFRRATGFARLGLTIGAANLVLPQYTRTDPLKMEIEDNIAASYLGVAEIDGTPAHVVWLKFEDSSGYGEQLLYFGEDDYLLRKASLTAPRVVLSPATTDGPETSYPNIHFELTLSALRVVDDLDDTQLAAGHEGYRESVPGDPPAIGESGPAWLLERAGGGSVASRDLRGEVAVLYFWASWCPLCQAYLPEIQKMHDELAGVRVIAINAFDRDDPLGYLADNGYRLEVLMQGDDLLANRLQFVGLPAMVVLDRDGTIRHRELVPRLDAVPALRSQLENLAAVPAR